MLLPIVTNVYVSLNVYVMGEGGQIERVGDELRRWDGIQGARWVGLDLKTLCNILLGMRLEKLFTKVGWQKWFVVEILVEVIDDPRCRSGLPISLRSPLPALGQVGTPPYTRPSRARQRDTLVAPRVILALRVIYNFYSK